MTQINITRFFETAEHFDFSASVAERGSNAGADTWRNAQREAAESPLLTTEETLDDWRRWLRACGGWDDAECAAFSDVDLNALFVQWVSGDIREMEDVACDDNGEIDWTKVETLQEAGNIASNIYRDNDGQIWFYLGC